MDPAEQTLTAGAPVSGDALKVVDGQQAQPPSSRAASQENVAPISIDSSSPLAGQQAHSSSPLTRQQANPQASTHCKPQQTMEEMTAWLDAQLAKASGLTTQQTANGVPIDMFIGWLMHSCNCQKQLRFWGLNYCFDFPTVSVCRWRRHKHNARSQCKRCSHKQQL